ncbi:trihelix transcription factor GT-3b-like [Bidens hawaiensis]|uniref:trihelix transcription factor GT-3b-like n=1 Tax=Bidens hawaiensis TaxID=980011 RepID=UPI00404A39D7
MDPRNLYDMSEGGDVGRFPQWSIHETRDLVMIRADLDSAFFETKRNKLLWEVISTKMKERGHNRGVEQCKTKWKNLVTRYKGMEQDGAGQHFPFYNELQEIFTNRMQRLLSMEPRREFSFDDHEDDNDNDKMEKAGGSNKKRNRGESSHKLRETVEKFMKQQMQTEMELMKMYEAREEERRMNEMEWRKRMEELEKEKLRLDEQWREREDQRRVREEARAEKRDTLVTALLNKLRS